MRDDVVDQIFFCARTKSERLFPGSPLSGHARIPFYFGFASSGEGVSPRDLFQFPLLPLLLLQVRNARLNGRYGFDVDDKTFVFVATNFNFIIFIAIFIAYIIRRYNIIMIRFTNAFVTDHNLLFPMG